MSEKNHKRTIIKRWLDDYLKKVIPLKTKIRLFEGRLYIQ